MKRLPAVALAVAACGGSGAPAHVVSVVQPAVAAGAASDPSSTPAPPAPAGASIAIGLGDARLCVLVGGHVHCRASGAHGERPLVEEPAIEGIEDAASLSVGARHACVVLRDGGVACFGDNRGGALGAGVAAESSARALRVKDVAGADLVVVGPWHTCARLAGGSVACWGENHHGQTGSDTYHADAARELALATPVPLVSKATSLALSWSTSCALTESGPLCWGRDLAHPQSKSAPPAPAAWLLGAAAIAGGGEALCAVRAGTVSCRGGGALVFSVGAVSLPSVASLGVGASHACALLADGTVRCWGQNYSGQIGRPRSETGANVATPQVVAGLPKVSALAVGGYGACALSVAEELHCWGAYPGAPREGGHEPSVVAIR